MSNSLVIFRQPGLLNSSLSVDEDLYFPYEVYSTDYPAGKVSTRPVGSEKENAGLNGANEQETGDYAENKAIYFSPCLIHATLNETAHGSICASDAGTETYMLPCPPLTALQQR